MDQNQLPLGVVLDDAPHDAATQASAAPDQGAAGLPPGVVLDDAPHDAAPAANTLATRRNAQAQPGVTPEMRQTSPVNQGLVEGATDFGLDHPLDAVKNAATGFVSGIWHSLPPVQLHDSVKQMLPIIDTYEKSRSGGSSVTDAIQAANQTAFKQDAVAQAVHQRVADFKKNPTRESVRSLADAVGLAASIYGTGGAIDAALAPAAEAAAPEAASAEVTSTTAKKPSLVQQIRKGGDVVQPEAEQALRTSVKAGGKEAGLSTVQPQSLRTIVEEPIHSLDASAKSLYRQIDQAAGTDFKALNEKLDNTEYQIRQLTETEEDVQKEAALEKSRTAIMEKIEAAKEQAKAAGVDPATLDRADSQFRQARALSDLETKVFKNPNIVKGNQVMGTAETVDVDSAVKALQKLQDSQKYGGSRLEQALGKDGASQLLKDLYDAQRVGTKALSRQQFAKWTARIVGLGTAEEVVRHAWQQ